MKKCPVLTIGMRGSDAHTFQTQYFGRLNMSAITLSVCIPSYNFGAFIGATLDSILPQLEEGIEVVVLDGGSMDDTVSVVQQRQQKYPQLRLHSQGFRGGIDKDIETLVGLAQGEYCWLFSADDLMNPGAIQTVATALKTRFDIYLCENTICDFHMSFLSNNSMFRTITSATTFELRTQEERLAYFQEARSSEPLFSFLAGPVFKKSVWDSADVPEFFRGTCWIIAGRLLTALRRGVTVHYLGTSLLRKRGDNDSFADRGIVNRIRIAIEDFPRVAAHVFGDSSPEMIHVKRVLRHDVPLMYLLLAKAKTARDPARESLDQLNQIVAKFYEGAGLPQWLKHVIFRLIPSRLLLIADDIRLSLKARKVNASAKTPV